MILQPPPGMEGDPPPMDTGDPLFGEAGPAGGPPPGDMPPGDPMGGDMMADPGWDLICLLLRKVIWDEMHTHMDDAAAHWSNGT